MKVWSPAGRSGDPAPRVDAARLDANPADATRADVASRASRAPRDRGVDALLFLLCVGMTVLTLVDDLQRNAPMVPTVVDAALGGLASLGIWLRRRWPVGLAVVVGLFAIYSMSASGVALVALFTVAVERRISTAVVIAAGYALTSLLSLLVRPDVPLPNWLQAGIGMLCVAAALAWGMFVRARRQLALAERERAASAQELLVAQARQMERNRIAREIHDVLAHRLSLLSLHAGSLELWPDATPAPPG